MTTQRATLWSVTINNPTPADDECISLARQKGWKVEGQLEQGDSGTPHYQLLVRTPQVRFSALKSAFPRAHIEVARNAAALSNYVHKEETRVAALPSTDEMYPSLSKFWDLIHHELTLELDELADEFDWSISDKRKLELFDSACSTLIERGYHVETTAVNPQIRSAFIKFTRALLIRSHTAQQHALKSQQINVPIIENADDNSSP